jgi:hypothetical protein
VARGASPVLSPARAEGAGVGTVAPCSSLLNTPRAVFKVDTNCTAPSLIPTVNGNTVRSFSTHGQLSAAQGSSTTVSDSDIRLTQPFDSSAHWFGPEVAPELAISLSYITKLFLTPRLCGLMVRRWRIIGYFLIHLSPTWPVDGSTTTAPHCL